MRESIFYMSIFLFPFLLFPQSKIKKDREAILKMCGCFEINFNFAETFNYSDDPNYESSKTYNSSALELALPIINKKNKISIQHLLIVGYGDQKSVIKHWRQDWLFQNTNLYSYRGDNIWESKRLSNKDVKGQWTQKVFQVDDSPRYEGTSSWVHVDGKSFWENLTPAPLPRREYTKRSDYNILERWNRQEITEYGWVHIQNNSKILKTDFDSRIIAKEFGSSPYKRVDIKKCAEAIDWWNSNKLKWESVRSEWEKIYHLDEDLSLNKKVNGIFLYEHLLFSDKFEESHTHEKLIKSYLK